MSNYTEFKVGDRVRRVKGYNDGSPNGHEAVISKIEELNFRDEDCGSLWATFEDETSGYLKYFELVTQSYKSPVVEKTVKTIVPGVYGIVGVSGVDAKYVYLTGCEFTASDLRHAAKVFEELASALEESQ